MSLRQLDKPAGPRESAVIRECPVCWRLVQVHSTFFSHYDKSLRRRCPMSGKAAPTRWAHTLRATRSQ